MSHGPLPAATCAILEAGAIAADQERSWPAESWAALRAAGALQWAVPEAQGGLGLSTRHYLEHQVQVAQHCQTTAFILSQHDAAVRRLAAWPGPVADQLLSSVARGECHLTVGISQLTTSRQHVAPVLLATVSEDAVHLNGLLPWVTAASAADVLLVGAVTTDARQVLVAVPRKSPNLTVREPYDLAALQGSLTAEVCCHDVSLSRCELIAGPDASVLRGNSGPGGLESTAMALGLCRAAERLLQEQAAHRSEWQAVASQVARETDAMIAELLSAAESPAADRPADLRGRANHLVLRATQAALAAAKGAGFLRSHPAQRWARQALFYLVWSCPRPALETTLQLLQVGDHEPCAAISQTL